MTQLRATTRTTATATLAAAAAALALLAPATARADSQADLAFQIGEKSSHVQRRVLEKLVTLKLGEACWKKVLARGSTAANLIASAAHRIALYGGKVTGEDWRGIENQSANTKEKNRELAVQRVDAFADRFHLTLTLEGDDCEASGNGLWLKYLGTVAETLAAYPPAAAKVDVTINVTSKVRAVTTNVSKSGAKFEVSGPRDIEKSGWPSDIEGPFKRFSKVK